MNVKLRFIDQGRTVIDTRSGLMWTRDAALEPFPLTWREALNYVAGLNARERFGHADWRLPNRRDLFSLVSYTTANPALQAHHPFFNVFNGYYWSSTTCSRLPDQAWYAHLGGARFFKGMKHGSYMVWPVRTAIGYTLGIDATGQRTCYTADGVPMSCRGSLQDGATRAGRAWPHPRFDAHHDTVTDRLTGLMWDRTADAGGAPLSWAGAFAAVLSANRQKRHGHDDWRLPGIRELESLCDLSTFRPALPEGHPFEHVQQYYWAATPSRYDLQYAWVLYLEDGAVGVGFKALSEFFIWLVRGTAARQEEEIQSP